MTQTTVHVEINDALAGLLDKYAVDRSESWQITDGSERPGDADDILTLAPGDLLTERELPELTVPLLAWRHQRRFVELKRLIAEETVEPSPTMDDGGRR